MKNSTNSNNSKTGLSQRALLVSVNISQWAGRKLDRKATATANSAHGADSNAGSYHKKLLPGADELKAVHTVASQARKFYYEQTLPWMSDGTRIISAKNYLDFATEFRKFKTEFDKAVSEFEASYPRLKNEAVRRLGDLYDASEYPENIGVKFNMDISFMPMPDSKDFRIEISETEKREFERKMQQVESAAMKDVWTRLHRVIKNAANKLSSPNAVFRDSLIENITEMTSILPRLNISDDAQLENAASEITDLVSKLHPDTLRTNKLERTKAAKALSDIESKMGAFMGTTANSEGN